MLRAVAATPGAPSRRSEEPLHGEGRDATPARETLPPAAAAVHAVCPFLLMGEGAWRSAGGLRDQRCGAVTPPAPLTVDKQRRLCVTPEHLACSTFVAADPFGTEAAAAVSVRGRAAGSTRWALARTAALVLEEGSSLPVVPPEIHARAREAGPPTPSLARLRRPAPAAPTAVSAGQSVVDRDRAGLEGFGEGVVAATSAWRARVDARLSGLRAGRAQPEVPDAAGVSASPLGGAITAAREGARARLSLRHGPWRPGQGGEGPAWARRRPGPPLPRVPLPHIELPDLSAPASRLRAAARERTAAFREILRARRVAPRVPVAGIRVAPSAARVRHAGARAGSPVGTLRLSGTPAARSRGLPAAHLATPRVFAIRR